LRKKASRGCETPRAKRSWGGNPSARKGEAQAEPERWSLCLQVNVEGPGNSRKANSMTSRSSDGRRRKRHDLTIVMKRIARPSLLGSAASGLWITSGKTPNVRARTGEEDARFTTSHHLGDSTAGASASKGRGGDIEPVRYEVIEADTLEAA